MTPRRGQPRAGTATIEFAMAALPLLMLIFGTIQGGLLFWTWQALESTAIDAAHCAAIDAASCQNAATTPANTQSYAVSSARLRGLGNLTTSNVTVSTGSAAQSACGGTTATVVSVKLSYNYGTIMLVPLPSGLTASACFPLTSSS